MAKAINTDGRFLGIHAEKNQDIEVENDENHWVGHDRARIRPTESAEPPATAETHVYQHNQTDLEFVRARADRTETVDKDETITIHANAGGDEAGPSTTVNLWGDDNGEIPFDHLKFQKVTGDWDGDGQDTLGLAGDYDTDGDVDGTDLA